jgi:RHS repeat-associated protein
MLDFTYGYNPGTANNGNIATWSATGWLGFNRSYTYDALNRLAAMTDTHTPNACLGLSWTYDAWGNRTAQSVTNGTCNTFSATVSTKNQLMGSPYTYDAAGNLTADGNHTYFYDAENRLTAVDGGNTAAYIYDALGRRVHKTLPGGDTVDYLYNLDGNVIGEWQVLTSPTYNSWGRSYIYLQGQLLARYGCSTTFFFHQDHLGSTRLVSAMDASIFASLDYLPFGEATSSSNSGCVPSHEFTGDERDPETGNDYAFARYYNPRLGRFMTPDPLGGGIGDPQSDNRYAYVLNDPMNLIDPSGLCGNDPRCIAKIKIPSDTGGSFSILLAMFLGGGAPSSGFFAFNPIIASVLPGGSIVADLGTGENVTSTIFGSDIVTSSILLTMDIGSAGGLGDGSNSGGISGSGGSFLHRLGERLACAAEFGDAHSLASATGTQNSFLGKAFLGNTFSGLTQLGLLGAGGPSGATATDVGIAALSGTHQGLPGGGNIGKGPLGVAQDAIIGGAAAVG